jgi:protein-L-isoaspartate(D-aspartate) O-methyltransferase
VHTEKEKGKGSFLQRFLLFSLFSFPFCAFLLYPQEDKGDARFRKLREEMVRTQIAAPRFSDAPAVCDPRVLEAMRRVPRHLFVPPAWAARAYDDSPLPIGHGQTISQPYMVAIMTELARPGPGHRALEIGTGSGYQAAILAELVREVFTIEIVQPLGVEARQRLRQLSYKNIEVRIGDGYAGWPEQAPFDLILVTAGAPHIPEALVTQLKPGGRMVIPVGPYWQTQILKVVTKDPAGKMRVEDIMPVRFVPLVRSNPEK